ncbi:fatty acid desaturase [Caulobacter sp. S45]|uniref:fatty acid desaturase n=1 Tax=Caulobacter sp. S45 TaxID=1641861 RepID=UPI00131A9E8C|nr:fatty acid desaturase [Caulobacter sp. S45]
MGAVEWPTIGIALTIYVGWFALTFFHHLVPIALRVIAGGWLVAWHGSLQHEAIHGHPTRSRRVNTALAIWPLALWLPFEIYRRSHLDHHAAEHLTLPGSDCETRYLPPPKNAWARAHYVLEAVQAPLLGRLLIGPFVTVGRFLAQETVLVIGDAGRAKIWCEHLGLALGVIAWVVGVCGMGLGEYLLTFVYPGVALSLLRSFAEHRAHEDPGRRIAVVEKAPVLGLLYLNNNLHVVHHADPGAAWYRLPLLYRRHRAEVLDRGGPVYAGYREIFGRYLLRPHDRLVHLALDEGGTS